MIKKKIFVDSETYWKKKVKYIVKISKIYGYSDLDKEFWDRQPAIIISLITDIVGVFKYRSKLS